MQIGVLEQDEGEMMEIERTEGNETRTGPIPADAKWTIRTYQCTMRDLGCHTCRHWRNDMEDADPVDRCSEHRLGVDPDVGCEGWKGYADGPGEEFDMVEHPSHYCEGRQYEPDKVAADWGFTSSSYMYNALKYLSRAGRKVYDGLDGKQSTIRDLKKARWEIDRRIEELER